MGLRLVKECTEQQIGWEERKFLNELQGAPNTKLFGQAQGISQAIAERRVKKHSSVV